MMGKLSQQQHRWRNHRTQWDRIVVWMYKYFRFRWTQYRTNILNQRGDA